MKPDPITLVLPVAPAANRYWRSVTRMIRDKRTGVVKPRAWVLLSDEAEAYKATVALMLQDRRPMMGPVAVTLRWFRGRRSGDLDGRIKVLLDALQGSAIENDSQVVELHAYRGEDPAWPRIEVMIELVGDVPLRIEA